MATQPTTPPRPNLRIVLAQDADARRAMVASSREAFTAATEAAAELRRAYQDVQPHLRRLGAALAAFGAAYRSARQGQP